MLKEADTKLFLFLNGIHSAFFDALMSWASKEFIWIPFYLLLLYLVYRTFPRKTLLILVCTALLIGLSDQISVHLFKNVFLRYRPTHNLLIAPFVHTVNGYTGGLYGFVSSHASNTFALATFLSLLLSDKKRNWVYLLLIWAAFVSYTRIYLGVHYPMDVICGALLGSTLAFVIFRFYLYLSSIKFNKTEVIHE